MTVKAGEVDRVKVVVARQRQGKQGSVAIGTDAITQDVVSVR